MSHTLATSLLGLAGLVAASTLGRAQQLPAPVVPAAAADVLLLATGEELVGRVLTITPTELTYLPAATSAPDTLRVPAASVFLVRYANGTREVMASLTTPAAQPDLSPPRLRGLSATERRAAGQRDARFYYHGTGPFWGSLASTVCLGPGLGMSFTACFAYIPPRLEQAAGPQRSLLADPGYHQGFKYQTERTKHRQAWTGYGVGCGVFAALLVGLFTR